MSDAFQLKVLTLNIWGIWFTRDQNLRLRALGAALEERPEDIVCLQEVWQARDRAFLVEKARRCGYIYSAYFAAKGVGSGLLVLSIFPIVETHFQQFRLRGRADQLHYGDYIAGKGVGLARIKTPAGMVDVYNTHTIAQYQSDKSDMFRAHRRTQHYEISEFIRAHTEENPVILAGDFNMRPDHPNHTLITTLCGLIDCFATVHPDDPGFTLSSENPYHSDDPDLRLDYIFARDGHHLRLKPFSAEITLKSVPYTAGRIAYSDHYGVSVALEAHPRTEEIPPQYEHTTAVYDSFKAVLDAGIEDATARHAEATTRYRKNLIAFLLLVMVGRVAGKRVWLALLTAMFMRVGLRWRIAKVDLPQEIAGLKYFSSVLENKKRDQVDRAQ